MKKISKLTALFLGIALALTACSATDDSKDYDEEKTPHKTTAKTEEPPTETTPSVEVDEDGLVIAKSNEYYDFCTKHITDYSDEWVEDEGLYIYTSTEGYICSVNVWRDFDTKPTEKELADGLTEDMKTYYGDSLLEIRDPDYYDIAGKRLYGIDYIYETGEYTIRFLRLYEMNPGSGYVMYTCKYVVDSEYAMPTLQALETAILHYREDRSFYKNAKPLQSQQPTQTQEQRPSGGLNNGNFKIVPSISKTIEYETYSDGWATIDYPKGWVIKSCNYDGSTSSYEIHAYDPEAPDRQFYFAAYSVWFSDEAARSDICSLFPENRYILGGYPCLLGGTQPVQEMFMNFNSLIDSAYGANMDFSPMYNWTETEHFGNSPLGAELIRGRYSNSSGEEIDGIFSGERMQPLLMNGFEYPGGFNTPLFFSAPAGEFNEWQPILSHCIDSLRLTDDYIDAFYSEQSATMAASRINADIANDISDMITSSWNARQTTYDIISAKQSDAILGYDRIYNTDTNEVYRIEVGLFDSYSGTEYQMIDDSMYSIPVSGYIYAE